MHILYVYLIYFISDSLFFFHFTVVVPWSTSKCQPRNVEAKMPTLDSSKAMMFLGLGDWWWFDGDNHVSIPPFGCFSNLSFFNGINRINYQPTSTGFVRNSEPSTVACHRKNRSRPVLKRSFGPVLMGQCCDCMYLFSEERRDKVDQRYVGQMIPSTTWPVFFHRWWFLYDPPCIFSQPFFLNHQLDVFDIIFIIRSVPKNQ